VRRERQKTLSDATFSGFKENVREVSHRVKAVQIHPFPCCRVLEIHIIPKYQQWEFLAGFALVQTKNSGYHWN